MDGVDDGSLQLEAASRRKSAPIDPRWLIGFVLSVIGVLAAIVGVVVAAAIGQTTVALIIALVAGAFFARVAC